MTVKIQRTFILIGLLFSVLLSSGCDSHFVNKMRFNEFSEELYIDAKLDFAIKHPSNWKRIKRPVSSPSYRSDTVIWQVENPVKPSDICGRMQIQSLIHSDKTDLPDLLSRFLTDKPELTSGQAGRFEHPAGPALRLLGHDVDHGRLTIALQGQQRDFIISLDYPNSRFDELLPVFQDIVASFTEINRQQNTSKSSQ